MARVQIHSILFISLTLLVTSASADVPEYQDLMSCYNPGMLVVNTEPTKIKCTKRVWDLAQKTKEANRLITFTEIVSSAHSNEAAIPFLERSLRLARVETCQSPGIALLILSRLSTGESRPLKSCQPLSGVGLTNLMMHAKDPETRQKVCQYLKSDFKKNKMSGVCDQVKK